MPPLRRSLVSLTFGGMIDHARAGGPSTRWLAFMTANDVDLEKRLLAAAVFELRVLLSAHINPDDKSPAASAALFAYALHNQALAVLDGEPIDVAKALDSVAKLESRLGVDYVQQFRRIVLNEPA